jgi:hypothetical protein
MCDNYDHLKWTAWIYLKIGKNKLSNYHKLCHVSQSWPFKMDDVNYCFLKKIVHKIFQNCATCHNKKTLRWTTQIITHLQENKYAKSLKCAMCP